MSRITKYEPTKDSMFPYKLKDDSLATQLDCVHKLGMIEDLMDKYKIQSISALEKRLKKNKYYYVVSHTVSEYSSVQDGVFDTFEEAKEKIKETCDWYCSKGSGRIAKKNANHKTVEDWFFQDNKVTGHYSWGEKGENGEF